jgi:GNAT superfamily N-acetyltransferase
MIRENLIEEVINTTTANFMIKLDRKMAVAEISLIDKEVAFGYLEMSKQSNRELFNELVSVLNRNEPVYFFNRLNVPKDFRGNGYGTLLLKKVLDYCLKNNYMLINTANEYGEMGQDNLINFYEKNGMKLIEKSGLFVYHNSINSTLNIVKNKVKIK